MQNIIVLSIYETHTWEVIFMACVIIVTYIIFAIQFEVNKIEKRLTYEKNKQRKVEEEFFGTLAHELKTPVAVILGSIEILKSGKLKSDGSLLFNEIKIAAKRLDDYTKVIAKNRESHL